MTILASVNNKSVMPGITPIADVPDAPSIGTVTVTNTTTVSVPFTAATTGGSPTSYTVTATPSVGDISTNAGTTSPRTVTGTFASDTAYTFTIRGVNSTASGPVSSSSNSITPRPPATVTGGTLVSNVGGYNYRIFTSNGTLGVSNATLTADVLTIAGGGGGGFTFNGGAGGAGAGGIFYASSQSLSPANYNVTIGQGGTSVYDSGSTNGNDSQFGSLTLAKGGGFGGRQYGGGFPGANGGSGGGGGGSGTNPTGGTSTQTSTGGTGYGNVGGQGGGSQVGGGGGGSGAAGASGNSGGAGGNGTDAFSSWLSAITSAMSGVSGWGTATSTGRIAGGGGNNPGSAGGAGGGANGPGGVGTANTGGGGSGGNNQTSGANGGSGLVVVRWAV
jgi:hypothetical protein